MAAFTSKSSRSASIGDAGPKMKSDIEVAEAALRNSYADIVYIGNDLCTEGNRDRLFKAFCESKHGHHVPDPFAATEKEYFDRYYTRKALYHSNK